MSFPAFFIDNFYENPEKVLKIANNSIFLQPDGHRPGRNSIPLHISNPEFFSDFCSKLFSIFYNFDSAKVEWNVLTYFQKSECLDDNPESPKNMPWIHKDDGNVIAGLIYLNENNLKNSGTSVYKLKKECSWDSFDNKIPPIAQYRYQFYKYGVYDEEKYIKRIKENYEIFEESVRFENRYNRLICYSGEEFHRAHSYYCEEPRLTQLFFVKSLNSDIAMPLLRKTV